MPLLNVAQGTINRLRASVIIPGFPGLNVTAPYLGKDGIKVAFEGNTTLYINTQTGAVTSPEPYLKVTVTMNLLQSQALADLYKSQIELSALLGDLTVRPSVKTLKPYQFTNCSIQDAPPLDFSGASADYNVVLGGVYLINSALWNG